MSSSGHRVVVWSTEPLAGPVAWAVETLAEAVRTARVGLRVGLVRPGDDNWATTLDAAGAPCDLPAESFALVNPDPGDPQGLRLAAADDRGLVYGLLDLVDVLTTATDPAAALAAVPNRYEHPHVGVRSVSRLFTSYRLDSVWLHDRDFWDEYLTELATHRFNRFSLAFGLAYDYLIDKLVVDNYLCFLYPFVLEVPGYDVQVERLTVEERERNLATLRYIAEAATRRGLEFSLGLWNHAYRLDPVTPTEKWLISGLDADRHAQYCADALALLLTEIPEITALTFRVHFEGGVPEPTHDFWRTVMTGLGRVDRTIALDAHAKGINDDLLDALRSAGSPLTLSTKYWGEHMGLPYHQAAIREKELTGHLRVGNPGREQSGESGHASGADVTRRRSFTRYGYADYARADADYGLIHRVWPGTQRVLTLGDPATAAGIGREATFAGAVGIEWFDALTFWGKKDSAEHPLTGEVPVERTLYADAAIDLPGSATWRKYRIGLRLNGRLAYDPDASPEIWQRWFTHAVGAAGPDAEAALACASRVLPLITTAFAPSVAGNIYWPEMDVPLALIEPAPISDNPFAENGWRLNGQFDMTEPYTFGNTSPLDPELFANADAYVDSLVDGSPTVRYSPLEVADWLVALAAGALSRLDAAQQALIVTPSSAEQHAELARMSADVAVASHLGRSFAAKLRAAVAWRWHGRTGSVDQLTHCLAELRRSRDHWAAAAEAGSVYRDDVPFGQMPYQRGHWRDRLPEIDAQLAEVAAHPMTCTCRPSPGWVVADRTRLTDRVGHMPPDRFESGRSLSVTASVTDPRIALTLHYRPVDQSARWRTVPMVPDPTDGSVRTAEVPAEATVGPFSVQYYLELSRDDDTGSGTGVANALWPGLDPVTLSDQPYYVVHADPAVRWGRTTSHDRP